MSYALPEPPWDLIGTPRWQAYFDELICPKCGEQGFDGILPGKSPHFGLYVCWGCGYHNWMPKPRAISERKRRRPARRFEPLEDDRCITCGGTRAELESIGRQLHDGHIVDRAELIEQGLDPDDPANHKWLCNFCHEDEQAKRRDLKRLIAAVAAA